MKIFFSMAVTCSLLLFACEKKIDFNLKNDPSKLVVEASIENGQAPVVILSRSVGYFSKISPEILDHSFVHNADVFVSNGTVTHKLKEYSKPVSNGITVYFYSVDSANLSTAFTGQLNHSYSLKIVSEGKEYTAGTTIPKITKRIDSLWWKPVPATTDSSKVIVMIRVTDPPGYGDYIRYYTKRNNEPFYPPFNSVFDDLFIDGTTYDIQVEKGVDRNVTKNDADNFFSHGDTVTIKLSNIDKSTFDFWRTLEYSYRSVGNPFSTPTKVIGNINGNALGYFGGYASQYRSIIIPR